MSGPLLDDEINGLFRDLEEDAPALASLVARLVDEVRALRAERPLERRRYTAEVSWENDGCDCNCGCEDEDCAAEAKAIFEFELDRAGEILGPLAAPIEASPLAELSPDHIVSGRWNLKLQLER